MSKGGLESAWCWSELAVPSLQRAYSRRLDERVSTHMMPNDHHDMLITVCGGWGGVWRPKSVLGSLSSMSRLLWHMAAYCSLWLHAAACFKTLTNAVGACLQQC